MARKKIIFVIVEGTSDGEALDAVLSKIYSSQTVYMHIMHTDITTLKNVNPCTINGKIKKEIEEYKNANHFKKDDFKEIIHIVDMDGAFISPDNIIEDNLAINPYYSSTEIRTCRKKDIEKRNKQKKENINRLCTYQAIWDIPYRVFYMSCNLDHVLYNKLNCSDEEKAKNSYEFAKRYKDHVDDFLNYISKSDFSVIDEYKKSWDYIKIGLRSLERHTNLGVCFENIPLT